MYEAYELMPNLRRKDFGPFDTLEDALEFISAKIGKVLLCEEDEEHDDHYDVLTQSSRIVSIEPAQ